MAAEHPDAYWRAVALGIEAENQKATVYVTHDPSLGIAREAILRKVVINETPGPFNVRTGLIRAAYPNPNAQPYVSKQCDLLVYDPQIDPPLCSVDDFVVVHVKAAKFVIEVKSSVDESGFAKILEVWESVRRFNTPMGAFAFEGVKFETFLTYLADNIKGHANNLPECIAVHNQNYVAFRYHSAPEHYSAAKIYFALNFNEAEEKQAGRATAVFLRLYSAWLLEHRDALRVEPDLAKFFEKFSLPPKAKKWISPEGDIKEGPLFQQLVPSG